MEEKEIQSKLDLYVEAYGEAKERLGSDDAAAAVVAELGKDLRTETIRSEWRQGLTVKRGASAAGRPGVEAAGGDVPATAPQIGLLRRLGVREIPAGLSKSAASTWIDELQAVA